jgi:hypothetical protein
MHKRVPRLAERMHQVCPAVDGPLRAHTGAAHRHTCTHRGTSGLPSLAACVLLWCCGAVVLWCCGAVVLWCCAGCAGCAGSSRTRAPAACTPPVASRPKPTPKLSLSRYLHSLGHGARGWGGGRGRGWGRRWWRCAQRHTAAAQQCGNERWRRQAASAGTHWRWSCAAARACAPPCTPGARCCAAEPALQRAQASQRGTRPPLTWWWGWGWRGWGCTHNTAQGNTATVSEGIPRGVRLSTCSSRPHVKRADVMNIGKDTASGDARPRHAGSAPNAHGSTRAHPAAGPAQRRHSRGGGGGAGVVTAGSTF